MRTSLTGCPAKVSPKHENAPQQAGIAKSAWMVQASVEMAEACFMETAVRVSMVGELERKIMGKEFSEQAVIDGSLSDLLVAYELMLETARHSSGENVKRAKAAAALLDVCFQNFSHFGSKSAVGLLEGQMEKLRLLPTTPSADTLRS
jgi:hypothetical protein